MPVNIFHALAGTAAALAVPAAALGLGDWSGGTPTGALPQLQIVEIGPGSLEYPLPGEFLVGGRPAAALTATVNFDRPIQMMKYQVSLGDYQRCVDASRCEPADAVTSSDGPDVPVTGVNYLDAIAYADWLSDTTGERWRLPTAAEWAFAAGERFAGSQTVAVDDPGNPASAWISRYRDEAAARRAPDPRPRPRGSFGPNAHGLEDMAGNVFEWTATCFTRFTLEAGQERVAHATDNCGARVLEGRHRSYMANFIRDGRSGGCAVGTAPENLGFRLVMDQRLPLLARVLGSARAFVAAFA